MSEKATSAALQTEDWSLNLEICDIINETDDGCCVPHTLQMLQIHSAAPSLGRLNDCVVLQTQRCSESFKEEDCG